MTANAATIRKLAQDLDPESSYESDTERLFGLLVQVAQEYIEELEAESGHPEWGRTEHIDCAIAGLTENLDLWEEESL